MADAADPTAQVFACRGLSVTVHTARGQRTILEDVDFDVFQGEFVSIIGGSGTGKTTLLRALAGLQPVDTPPSLLHFGEVVQGPPSDAAFVFQNYAASMLPWRTVGHNVELGIEGKGLSKKERESRVLEALSLVNLAERRDDYPWQLSGGMQQRVQIARALALRPKVLLMDEPFGALDAMTKQQLQDEVQRLQSASGVTVVFVTHDIEEAVYLSDRIVVLSGSPARISREIPVEIARPRTQIATRELPHYLELRRETYNAIHPEVPAQAGAPS